MKRRRKPRTIWWYLAWSVPQIFIGLAIVIVADVPGWIWDWRLWTLVVLATVANQLGIIEGRWE